MAVQDELVAAAERAVAVSSPDPNRIEFYQRLLAAELSTSKCRILLEEIGTLSIDGLLRHPLLSSGERERAQQANIAIASRAAENGVIILSHHELPQIAKESPLAIPGLFAWGDVDSLSQPTIAIVGTREATTYGKAVAQKFSEAFAKAGVTVVSGGAYGIDAAAHRGALAVGGKTVAVLLSSIDKVYPLEHRGLFRQIRDSGCLVSQFAVGSGPGKYRPLQRNQTIAALSLGVLLVEVPARSGAIATAHAANDHGRQVFVVPANIDLETFRGSHALIRDGATLVDHPDQVLNSLGIEATASASEKPILTELQSKIVSVLTTSPLSADAIVMATGLSSAEVLSELTMLELDGAIMRAGAGFAIRI